MNVVLVVVSILVASCSGDELRVGDCSCEGEQITRGCEEECRLNTDRHGRASDDCKSHYLASDSCWKDDRYDDATCMDKWYFEFVGGDHSLCYGSAKKCAENKCCSEGKCRLPENYTEPSSGYIPKAENVALKWLAAPDETNRLVMTWSQPQPDNIAGYQLLISSTLSSDFDAFFKYIDRCICIPASTRFYSVRVAQGNNAHLQVKLASLPYATAGLWNDQNRTVTITDRVPQTCWELEGANYDICGVLVPGPPCNVTISAIRWNSSSIVLTVTWSPPERYYPKIIGYKIHINDSAAATVNGMTLNYSTVINISSTYEVWVQASNLRDDSSSCGEYYFERSCVEGVCASYCWGPPYINVLQYTITPSHNDTNISSTTIPPVRATKNYHTILVASLSTTGMLLLLIVGAIVVILAIKGYLQHKRSSVYLPMMSSPSPPPTPISDRPMKVFVVNCPQSSDEDKRLVRNLCHNLADHSIEPISLEYSTFESGPGQVGIYQWTEEQFTNCDMIVFVCNKSLHDVWGDSESDQDAFVSASRQLLQAHLLSGENVSKFAIALLRQSDKQYIPSLYLKNIRTFTLFSDGHCDEEDLVRYIKQVPHFVRPQVRSAVEEITILTENVV